MRRVRSTDQVTAIVLAAGAGSRFGGHKLLATVEGRPILQHVLDRLAEAGLADVIVVIGDDADEVETAITWRSERRVRNPDPGAWPVQFAPGRHRGAGRRRRRRR